MLLSCRLDALGARLHAPLHVQQQLPEDLATKPSGKKSEVQLIQLQKLVNGLWSISCFQDIVGVSRFTDLLHSGAQIPIEAQSK